MLHIVPVGELDVYTNGFARQLKAANLAPRTIETFLEGVERFTAFLAHGAHNSPKSLHELRRSHVEAFIAEVLETGKPATAANRFRSLQQFLPLGRRRGRDRVLTDGEALPAEGAADPAAGAH